MANGYKMNNLIKGAQSTIAIGASETDTVISDEVPMSAADSLNLAVRVEFDSSATAREVTGITLSLQHSYTGTTWEDVGTQADGVIASTLATVADADVGSTANNVTSTSHPFVTGDAVYYVSSAGNEITGLTDDTVYYAIDEAANTFQLATTKANALAGTAISLTQPSGGDTHYFTSVEPVDIVMNIENSSDEAQLPIFPKARVVMSSGASDAITVSGVYFTRRL